MQFLNTSRRWFNLGLLTCLTLIMGLLPGKVQAQDCNYFDYFPDAEGFLCGDNDGEFCLTYSQDYAAIGCSEGYHFEISIFDPGATVTDLYPYYLIDAGSLTEPVIVGLQPELLYDADSRLCFDLSLYNNTSQILVEVVNNNDPTDRLFPQTLGVAEQQIGSPGTTTYLSNLIATGQLPAAAAEGRFHIDGDLVIDQNYQFGSFGGSPTNVFTMGPDAGINVVSGRQLSMLNSRLESCTSRWRSVEVAPSATLFSWRTTIRGAYQAIDLADAAQLYMTRSLIEDCETGIRAIEVAPGGPNIFFSRGRAGVVGIRDCTNGIQLHNAGDVVLNGDLTVFEMENDGIQLTGSTSFLTLGGRFLLKRCGGAGISATHGVPALDVSQVGLEECTWGIRSSGTSIVSVSESQLFSNGTGIASSQFAFGFLSIFRPTELRIQDNEFLSNGYDIVGFERESKALISSNSFILTKSLNVALYGDSGFEQRWVVQNNADMESDLTNFYFNQVVSARVRDNLYFDAGQRSVEIYGGEDIRFTRNDAKADGDIAFIANGSPMNQNDCNIWDGDLAVQYLGMCGNTKLLGNTMNSSGYNFALGSPSQSNTLIGNQPFTGNLFDPSSPSNPKAIASSTFSAQSSKFLVGNPTQGTSLYPYFVPASSPWFTGFNANNFSCSGPYSPPGKIPNLQETIDDEIDARDSLLAGPSKDDVELKLYRHILELESLQTLSTSHAGVKAQLEQKLWAPAIEAEFELKLTRQQLSADSTERERLLQNLTIIASQRKALEIFVEDSSTQQTSVDSVSLAQDDVLESQYADTLAAYLATFETYELAVDSALVTSKSLLAQATGEGVVSSEYIFALGQSLDISAGTLPTEADQQAIRNLAADCPSQKGEGVFVARSLVAALDNAIPAIYTWCDDSGVSSGLVVGNKNLQQDAFTVYPNPSPSASQLTLSGRGVQVGAHVELLDLTGRIVMSGSLATDGTYQLPELAAGLYLLKLNGASSTRILIKNE